MEGSQNIAGAVKFRTKKSDKPFKRKSCAKPFIKKSNKMVAK